MNGRVLDFGVTGKLRFSNLIMYDRQTESWWQEFGGEAIVGDYAGLKLENLPLSMVSWKEFKSAFPDAKVMTRVAGSGMHYAATPYVMYDTATPYLYNYGGPEDDRLPPMERVVGIIIADESLAVPFSVLEKEPVVHYTLAGQGLVVFFKKGTASALDHAEIAFGEDVGATGVFDPDLEGRMLTFKKVGEHILDDQTGSTWNLLGQATLGPLKGKALTRIPNRGAQLWFSLVPYEPDTVIYTGK